MKDHVVKALTEHTDEVAGQVDESRECVDEQRENDEGRGCKTGWAGKGSEWGPVLLAAAGGKQTLEVDSVDLVARLCSIPPPPRVLLIAANVTVRCARW